ncbi:MAG: hypothetical protein Q4D45_02235 [Lachnospiraceae bacterium]|jgi:DNA-binding helix-turn-helix protein|nr:hypothetical protein [Lachnospiraceae bacterium]
MDKRNNDFVFVFKPIGQAPKAVRKAQGMTREQLARIPRHLDTSTTTQYALPFPTS